MAEPGGFSAFGPGERGLFGGNKALTPVGTAHGALFSPPFTRPPTAPIPSKPHELPRTRTPALPAPGRDGGCAQKGFSCCLLPGLPGAQGRGQLAHEAPEGKAKPELRQRHGTELTRTQPSPARGRRQAAGGRGSAQWRTEPSEPGSPRHGGGSVSLLNGGIPQAKPRRTAAGAAPRRAERQTRARILRGPGEVSRERRRA